MWYVVQEKQDEFRFLVYEVEKVRLYKTLNMQTSKEEKKKEERPTY